MNKFNLVLMFFLFQNYCLSQNNDDFSNRKDLVIEKNICGHVDEYGKEVTNCLPINAHPCRFKASRDSFIPNPSISIKYFYLLVIVVDSNIYGVTQENVDNMVAGANNYYAPWKIGLCYSTVFINSSMISQFPQNPDSITNVLISDWPNLGLSGNPIKIDYSVVVNNNYKGAYSLAHEFGHNLNLSHTFSSTNVPTNDVFLGCTSPCRDRVDYTSAQQDTVGDGMSDTPPTPVSYSCAPPTGVDSCSVGMPSWPSWGYENIMGYSSCLNATFSPQQAGRMHCYIEYGFGKLPKKIAYGTQHCITSISIFDYQLSKEINFEVLPNPFKKSTTINFKVPEEGIVSIEVYNYLGQKITDLFNARVSKEQQNKIEFFTNNLSSGIYYAKLKSANKVLIKKMIIAK